MAKVKITQIKSKIGSTKRQRATLETLGLRRINHTVEKDNTPEVMGMVEKVRHLVKIDM
ncbi:MAG TPA: 50S ribosomal protein L30 [Tenuifilaceae bacterium]|nr:50S ribosomal protein L30 [Tenuifilaceae bacterium]HPE17525.1 50S ribosomal protein L30 [Tenuifilaceae bacterium]HPJ45769.1 50S ribosomal protein L30 [Tenuifilaceae bacterium]HPQ34027.1 50S ribosomal protein L30 [Tenuifilaceae bacterium]HRX68984.1 50S ribosomal protein L30 [Tenuifilaceae bacterium]